jgi:hypothetical protein
VDAAELKRWEEQRVVDDLTKQRNADRAKGLMPAPGPSRPWVKPSFPAPSNESKQLMSPSMRRQCDVWGKAYSAQQAKQRLEAQAAKRKRDDEEGGTERKKPRTRRSRSRSPRGDPPPPPPGNPPSGNSSADSSSARDSSARDASAGGSRSSGSSTRRSPGSPAGQSLTSGSTSNMPPPTFAQIGMQEERAPVPRQLHSHHVGEQR